MASIQLTQLKRYFFCMFYFFTIIYRRLFLLRPDMECLGRRGGLGWRGVGLVVLKWRGMVRMEL